MNIFQEAREAFKPDDVKVLFLAEAPPCKPDRFFYFPDVTKGDSLFLHIIREVFPELKQIPTKQIRAMKEELLIRFREEGFYVMDSSENSGIKSLSQVQKIKIFKEEQKELLKKISPYKLSAKIVLLSAAVFKANHLFLREAGFKIMNSSPIPFPGSGQQNNFKKAFAEIEFNQLLLANLSLPARKHLCNV